MLERKGEGPGAFYEQWDRAEAVIVAALEATNNLLEVRGDTLSEYPSLWQALRYFCGPPISEEDLWTLVGRKFRTVRPDFAQGTAEALTGLFDVRRFTWLETGSQPTPVEVAVAIKTTAILMAHEALRTSRRGSAARRQEDEVASALASMGLTLDASRERIDVLDTLARGSFSRERKVDGAKCDVPVRLGDGRLLALECKVSNGPKNSWKRLHRETGGKAERWRQQFGSQVITGAVLSGVYDLSCLQSAQSDHDVYLFWQHDLKPLLEFIGST